MMKNKSTRSSNISSCCSCYWCLVKCKQSRGRRWWQRQRRGGGRRSCNTGGNAKEKQRKKRNSKFAHTAVKGRVQKQSRNPVVLPHDRTTTTISTTVSSPHQQVNKNKRNNNNTSMSSLTMKCLRNDNYWLGEEVACYIENIQVVVNEALEKQWLVTNKNVGTNNNSSKQDE